MPRLEPLPIDVLPAGHQALIQKLNELLGFECHDWLTIARVPPVMTAALKLCNSVPENATDLGELLRSLVCYACSRSAACQYRVPHTAYTATRFGMPEEKRKADGDFDRSPYFSAAEKTALRVAAAAGRCPNDVSDADFAALSEHY